MTHSLWLCINRTRSNSIILILDFVYSNAADLVRPSTACLLAYWNIVGLDKETRVQIKGIKRSGIKF